MTNSKIDGTLAAMLGLAMLTACGGADDATGADADSTEGSAIEMGEAMMQGSDSATLPDWAPQELYLPDDFAVTNTQEIGTRTFILEGTSAAAQDELLSTYRSELEAAGYDVTPLERMATDEPVIYFNGNGLESAAVRITDAGDTRAVHVDFSKDLE